MLENYRTSSIWDRFMRNSYVKAGLAAAGFTHFGPAGVGDGAVAEAALLPNLPNPFSKETTLAFRLPAAAPVRLSLYDIAGREVARPVDGMRVAGEHHVAFDARGLAAGVYFCRLEVAGRVQQRRAILIR